MLTPTYKNIESVNDKCPNPNCQATITSRHDCTNPFCEDGYTDEDMCLCCYGTGFERWCASCKVDIQRWNYEEATKEESPNVQPI